MTAVLAFGLAEILYFPIQSYRTNGGGPYRTVSGLVPVSWDGGTRKYNNQSLWPRQYAEIRLRRVVRKSKESWHLKLDVPDWVYLGDNIPPGHDYPSSPPWATVYPTTAEDVINILTACKKEKLGEGVEAELRTMVLL